MPPFLRSVAHLRCHEHSLRIRGRYLCPRCRMAPGERGSSQLASPWCRTGAGDQKPSDARLLSFGACSRHASTYQLRPLTSSQTPFHAGGWRQWSACSWGRLDHPEAPARLWAERRDEVTGLRPRVHGSTVDRAGSGRTERDGETNGVVPWITAPQLDADSARPGPNRADRT